MQSEGSNSSGRVLIDIPLHMERIAIFSAATGDAFIAEDLSRCAMHSPRLFESHLAKVQRALIAWESTANRVENFYDTRPRTIVQIEIFLFFRLKIY